MALAPLGNAGKQHATSCSKSVSKMEKVWCGRLVVRHTRSTSRLCAASYVEKEGLHPLQCPQCTCVKCECKFNVLLGLCVSCAYYCTDWSAATYARCSVRCLGPAALAEREPPAQRDCSQRGPALCRQVSVCRGSTVQTGLSHRGQGSCAQQTAEAGGQAQELLAADRKDRWNVLLTNC